MTPVTREEIYLAKLAGETVTVPSPVSRKEMYLAKACGEAVTVPDPVSREEMYLYKLAGGSITLPSPVSRLELLMAAACGEAVTPYDPVSRLEWFWTQVTTPKQTITGVPPIVFTSDGTALSSWIIYGNGSQTGTPTPSDPVTPQFVGTLSGADWTIPIACAGQTTTVDLGHVQTVRRVRKLVLSGSEDWTTITQSGTTLYRCANNLSDKLPETPVNTMICNHLRTVHTRFACATTSSSITLYNTQSDSRPVVNVNPMTLSEWIAFIQQQYANGTPVTIWYVLSTPETAIVNEPLAKIGDHADGLHSEDAGVTIPTVSGSNTLTIGTTLQPSSVSITGHISQ